MEISLDAIPERSSAEQLFMETAVDMHLLFSSNLITEMSSIITNNTGRGSKSRLAILYSPVSLANAADMMPTAAISLAFFTCVLQLLSHCALVLRFSFVRIARAKQRTAVLTSTLTSPL
jgi:hypothetical protein